MGLLDDIDNENADGATSSSTSTTVQLPLAPSRAATDRMKDAIAEAKRKLEKAMVNDIHQICDNVCDIVAGRADSFVMTGKLRIEIPEDVANTIKPTIVTRAVVRDLATRGLSCVFETGTKGTHFLVGSMETDDDV